MAAAGTESGAGTHKVYLTEEQWARVCKADEEIAAEVEKQQPELYAKITPKKAAAHTAHAAHDTKKNA